MIEKWRQVVPALVATGGILLSSACDSPKTPKPVLDENGWPRPMYTVVSKNTYIPFTPTRVIDRRPSIDRTSPQEFLHYYTTYIDPVISQENPDLDRVLTRLQAGSSSSSYKTTAQLYGQPRDYHITNGGGEDIFQSQIYEKSAGGKIIYFSGVFNTDQKLSNTKEEIAEDQLESYAQLLLKDKNIHLKGRVYSSDVGEVESPIQTYTGTGYLKNGTEVVVSANTKGKVSVFILEK